MKNPNGLAMLAALGATAAVTTLIVLGSQGLRQFDWPLLPYALATIFCAGGAAYRCAAWFQRPPTKRYWRQSWRLWREGRVLPTSAYVGQFAVNNFAAQQFIARRGRRRWLAHLCLSWGTLMAFA